jgi:ABC-2 type transport system permease protein
LYPLSNLPPAIRYLSYIDPLTYGIDGMRYALTGFSVFPIMTDLLAMIGISFVMVIASAYLFEKSKVL